MKWLSALQLIRPANIVTAISDILAGIAIAGFLIPEIWNQQLVIQILLLIIATIGLYGGGIVFNDIFDIKEDRLSRPERVIPSGRISLKKAKILGISLFTVGILSATFVSGFSGLIAATIAMLSLLYDKYSKHNKFLGPLNMGLCRGINLILGMSINGYLQPEYFIIGLIPVIFVAAITLTAQKETKGKNKLAIVTAMILDLSIVISFVLMAYYFNLNLKNTAIFLLVWYIINAVAKAKAILNNNPLLIQKAVKMGVLSLIPLNASYVAGFSSIIMAFLVMCLLPLSLYLSKKFPVT
jgi:4-hydroxybenzoate polyprenyltransferase